MLYAIGPRAIVPFVAQPVPRILMPLVLVPAPSGLLLNVPTLMFTVSTRL
jgi:hypothetical protein